MNKHTNRYFKEMYGQNAEGVDLDVLAEAIRSGGDQNYIQDAIWEIEDEGVRDVFQTELIKKKYKFEG